MSGAARRTPWLLAVGWWLGILATVPVGRGIVDGLRSRGALTLSVGAGLAVAAVAVVVAVVRNVRRRRLDGRQATVALGVVVVGLGLASLIERPEERWHLVQYGVLGLLFWLALADVRSGLSRPVVAVLLTGIAGWLDEGLQYVLPDRVYDLRDVVLNAACGALGVAAAEISTRARVRED